jgi:hypothetical protein
VLVGVVEKFLQGVRRRKTINLRRVNYQQEISNLLRLGSSADPGGFFYHGNFPSMST